MSRDLWMPTLVLASVMHVFGLGADHPSDRPVDLDKAPAGLNTLINATNRVHGFFVNAEDRFFFSGDTAAFAVFPREYAAVSRITGHKLTIRIGSGHAKSPWDKGEGKLCDWMLEVARVSSREGLVQKVHDGKTETEQARFLAELPVWSKSRIDIEKVEIPADIVVVHESEEQFEAAWPHILAVKSKNAPLTLLSSPNDYRNMGEPIKAGVRILSPLTGTLVTPRGSRYPPGTESAIPDGNSLRIGPPWPDHIKSESGALPEYVFDKNGKWAPYDPDEKKDLSRYLRRARLDIELIVDGEIVDLNRIPLPADAPVIDKRFREDH